MSLLMSSSSEWNGHLMMRRCQLDTVLRGYLPLIGRGPLISIINRLPTDHQSLWIRLRSLGRRRQKEGKGTFRVKVVVGHSEVPPHPL